MCPVRPVRRGRGSPCFPMKAASSAGTARPARPGLSRQVYDFSTATQGSPTLPHDSRTAQIDIRSSRIRRRNLCDNLQHYKDIMTISYAHSMRVLDLTRVLAGPLCTMILGDMGADVIKVERPGAGDETRGWGPPFDADGASAYFLSVNRNKLCDRRRPRLQTPISDWWSASRARRTWWSRTFCPAHSSASVGASARRGAARPELVWCTITGFGSGSRRPGYDFVVQAESGWMSITGDAGWRADEGRRRSRRRHRGKGCGDRGPGGAGRARPNRSVGRHVHVSLAAAPRRRS